MKPVAYAYINDAGWENYAESIATKPENITEYADCFKLLVPMIQQASIDYLEDPTRTNALILDAVAEFDNGWVYSEGVADYGVETIKADGLVANGPDDTVGNFDLDRVEQADRAGDPGLRGPRPEPEGRADRRGHRHQRVHRPEHRFLTGLGPAMTRGRRLRPAPSRASVALLRSR